MTSPHVKDHVKYVSKYVTYVKNSCLEIHFTQLAFNKGGFKIISWGKANLFGLVFVSRVFTYNEQIPGIVCVFFGYPVINAQEYIKYLSL